MSAALFPVFLKLAGRRVLVVGGGPVAASKIDGLAGGGRGDHRRRARDDPGHRRGRRHPRAARVPAGRSRRRVARRGGGDTRRQPRGRARRGGPRRVRQRGGRSAERHRLSRRGGPTRLASRWRFRRTVTRRRWRGFCARRSTPCCRRSRTMGRGGARDPAALDCRAGADGRAPPAAAPGAERALRAARWQTFAQEVWL